MLQVDDYNGIKALADARVYVSMSLAFCWSHTRRYFYGEFVSTKSPLVAEICRHSAEHRRALRQERSRPIVKVLNGWLQHQVRGVSGLSDLAKAMRYVIRHWPGLVVFLEDGRV